MAACALASVVSFVRTVHVHAGVVKLWLGLLSLALIWGTSLCLLFALAGFLRVRQQRSRATGSATAVKTDGEYVAHYSRMDRGVALAVAVVFGTLTIFFWLRTSRPEATALAASVFCWAVFNAVQVTATRVRFNGQGIIARTLFRRISEPYRSVQRISGRPGTVRVHFSDGRSLSLHPGLGNPDVVIAYLHAHCPESVHLEDGQTHPT
jgi:hypothetical protein